MSSGVSIRMGTGGAGECRGGVLGTESSFTSWDGLELFYRCWGPAHPAERALFLFHRGHEHSGRWKDLVEQLDAQDTWVFALDARGHGRSPGERGYAENLMCFVRDVDAFVRCVCAQHAIPLENVVVVGHSVGAVIAATWVHDYAPPIRGMVLLTPAMRVKLYVPFAIPLLRMLKRIRGKTFIRSYVGGGMLTHDPAEANHYDADPLISRQIAVNILLDLHDTSRRLITDAGAVVAPTLVLAAGADRVVRVSAQRRFFERLSSPLKWFEIFDSAFHDLVHETDHKAVIRRIRDFVEALFARPNATAAPFADCAISYTRKEYEWLRTTLSPLSPRRWCFAALKWVLKTVGRLSAGVRLGWQTGFDSGATLDYVYENRPRGLSPLGRWIDRVYLNSAGWRGVRVRRRNLEQLLRHAIEALRREGRTVHVLDVAAGAGRYVIETLAAVGDGQVSGVLRDLNPGNLELARRLATDLSVENLRFESADAFDLRSYESLAPRPTIAVISGLYELFPDNQPVQRCLSGLAAALEPGGYLIYTNQPWHPQIELIARTLINREGQPWIMRRRTQAEMDQLVGAAGFVKLSQEIDPWGIFTVSLARRAGA